MGSIEPEAVTTIAQRPADSNRTDSSVPRAPVPKRSLSPRRRKLRRTLLWLVGLAVLGAGAGLLVYWAKRPATYRPDEASTDITSDLARGLPAGAPRPLFVDVTQTAGLAAFRNFVGDRTSQLPEDMGPGLAWGDYDNDGDDDLLLVSAGGALNVPEDRLEPCALFENLGDGRFAKASGFPEVRIRGMAAAWADYDDDGYLDLVLTGYRALWLFHNEPAGDRRQLVRDPRFPDRDGFWAGAAWGDYDNDRRLDLYVCGYVQYTANEADRDRTSDQLGTFVPYTLNPASYEGATNLLFRNEGAGQWREVAGDLGVGNPEGRSLGALWHDLDDDGWLDLYVANDVSDNVFYRNTGGRFEELSHAAYVADYRSAMGMAAGDWNRDGDDDLFIGHWVAQENALYDNLLADLNRAPTNSAGASAATPASGTVAPAPRRYGVRFMDVADLRGLGQIALPFVSWGTEFADFDGDGWLDLIVANGNTLEVSQESPRRLKAQEPFLFWNQHGEYFHNLAPACAALTQPHVSRGLAVSDYDLDGDLDIALAHLGEGLQLLRNDMQAGHWVEIRLRSRTADGAPRGFADGTKAIAYVDGVGLRRSVTGVSYLSQNTRTLHFGLGAARAIERLEVRWHAGPTNHYARLEADAAWEITEGEPEPRRLPPRTQGASASRVGANPVAGTPPSARERVAEFWKVQRAAMDAMKVETNLAKAIPLFRRVLELDPRHEDSCYYLAHCLALEGDTPGALAQLDELIRLNPQSHRAHRQRGILLAFQAGAPEEWAAAEAALEDALRLNPEETGALLALGEVALLRQDLAGAEARLSAACRTNPKAVGGFFLRGYLAWRRGDAAAARHGLEEARRALGPDWQPKGATSEGDVRVRYHGEPTPLSRFWEHWDGQADPNTAFARLAAWLGGP